MCLSFLLPAQQTDGLDSGSSSRSTPKHPYFLCIAKETVISLKTPSTSSFLNCSSPNVFFREDASSTYPQPSSDTSPTVRWGTGNSHGCVTAKCTEIITTAHFLKKEKWTNKADTRWFVLTTQRDIQRNTLSVFRYIKYLLQALTHSVSALSTLSPNHCIWEIHYW